MRLAGLIVAAWLSGLAAFAAAAGLVVGRTADELLSVHALAMSALATFVTFFMVATPCMFGMRRALKGCQPVLFFPLLATLLGVLPVVFLMAFRTDGWHAFLMHDAFLYYCVFLVEGLVFGAGFVLLFRVCPEAGGGCSKSVEAAGET
jgi:hypothetical protein